jgi:cell division protein FtsW (lipid II flippase)
MELGLASKIGTYYVDQPIIDSQVDNFETSTNLANTYPKSAVWLTFALNRLGILATYTTFGVIQPGAGFNLHYKIADVWLIFLALLFIVWIFTRIIYSKTWNPWPYVIIYWIADTILFYRG